MDNFKVMLLVGLLKILTFEFCILAKIIPLCRDPRLSLFTESFLITSLPNKTESGMACKKPARWPDCQILFEMDPIYQNKVSLKRVSLRDYLALGAETHGDS